MTVTTHEQHDKYALALKSAFGGVVAGVSTELLFYGLDSYKVVRQAHGHLDFRSLFRGALPIALLGAAPSFGVFFAGYGLVRDNLQERHVSASIAVLMSSLLNGIPSSLVAVPADVIKKQLILSSPRTTSSVEQTKATVSSVIRNVYRLSGIRGFLLGWQANMLKDIPFAAIKMSLYESLARIYLRVVKHRHESDFEHLNSGMLNKIDAAAVGFVSGAVTAVLTNPLDCANTRIKSGELSHLSLWQAHKAIVTKDGPQALFRGIGPRVVIIGFGSTVFWFFYSLASGQEGKH